MTKIVEAAACLVMLCPLAVLSAQDVKRSPVPDTVLHVGAADARGMAPFRAGAEPILAFSWQAGDGVPIWTDICQGPIEPGQTEEFAATHVLGVLTPSGVVGDRTGIEEPAARWAAQRDLYRGWQDVAASLDNVAFVARFQQALDQAGVPKLKSRMQVPDPHTKDAERSSVGMQLRFELALAARTDDPRGNLLQVVEYLLARSETCVKAVQP